MKNSINKTVLFLGLILVLIASSCNGEKHQMSSGSGRISGVECFTYNGHGYQIIKVDGIEYLSSKRGGVCPLVKSK